MLVRWGCRLVPTHVGHYEERCCFSCGCFFIVVSAELFAATLAHSLVVRTRRPTYSLLVTLEECANYSLEE